MRTAALFLAAPLFGGLLAWQLYGLEPERVCSIPAAFVDNKDLASILGAFNACIGLYAKSLIIKDHAVIGLLAILGLGYLMMMMRELRLQGEMMGPLGWGAKFRSIDDKEPPAPTVTTTTTVAPTPVPPTAAPTIQKPLE